MKLKIILKFVFLCMVLAITSYAYATDYHDVAVSTVSFTPTSILPGATTTFTVQVYNGDITPPSSHAVYVLVLLTNTATLQETEIYSSSKTISAGETSTYTVNWTGVAGNYTVTAIPYAEDRRATQKAASSALNVMDASKIAVSNVYSNIHYILPGTRINFEALVTNNDDDGQVGHSIYVAFVLTNSETSQETEVYTNAATVAYGSSQTFTASWTALKGVYTLTAIAFAEDRRTGQANSTSAVRVIDPRDFVDPTFLNMGRLPYGRYMFAMPVKIYWAHEMPNEDVDNLESWTMRVYTDNFTKWAGTPDAIHKMATFAKTNYLRAGKKDVNTKERFYREITGVGLGLISSDGKYNIPIRIWCANFGPDWDETGWNPTLLGPPSIHDDYAWKGPLLDDGTRDIDRAVWLTVPDIGTMTEDRHTWRRLIGVNPYDNEFKSDTNQTGDYTLENPFKIYIACETDATSVKGSYSTTLIIEIYIP